MPKHRHLNQVKKREKREDNGGQKWLAKKKDMKIAA